MTAAGFEPTFVERDALWVLGCLARMTPGSETPEVFAAVWQEFETRRPAVEPLSVDRCYYGVSFASDDGQTIDYLAGVIVAEPPVSIPEGLVLREIRPARYAVFACPVPEIGETYRRIFSEWLPQSALHLRSDTPAFECYPPAEDTTSPVLIHIPVE